MKTLKLLFPFLILFCFISSVRSQTVDDIINNYIAAVGGMDKLNSVQTLKVTGKFSGGGMDIPFVETIKKPYIRTDITMQGLTMITAYDGTDGWMLNPFQGSKIPEKTTAEQTKQMKDQADFEGKLVNYKEKGSTVELMGKEDMEGSDAYKIKLTDKDGEITYYYIDVASNLIMKETSKRTIKEKEIEFDTYYSDYKPVEGILIPFSMQVKSNGGRMENQKIVIDSVEINVPVDDSIFKMPESK
jgi:outer membrane lipoprotein-sorting protein